MPSTLIATTSPRTRYYHYAIALIAGTMTTLAFAPFHIMPLAILGPALLLYVLLKSPNAFRLGFCYGIGLFGLGVSWVFVVIHNYGNSGIIASSLVTAAFILFVSLFTALQCLAWQRFLKNNTAVKRLFTFPAFWVLQEWIRCNVLTGLPWLLIAYSHTDSPLRGFAPIVGVYGVSFISLFLSALLVNLLYVRGRTLFFCIFLFIAILASGWQLSHVHWTHKTDHAKSVALVQGNIAQILKWQPDYLMKIINTYYSLTQANWQHQIIVWPEGSIPYPQQGLTAFLRSLSDVAKQHHTTILAGIPSAKPHSNDYYNSMLVLGEGHGQYFKHHLVPFGEFVPLQSFLRPLNQFFNLPMTDITPGKLHQPNLNVQGVKLANFICYEIAFPSYVIENLNDATLLVTASDDSWFGHSIASFQQFQAARFRAIETGRYLLASGNNGVTAIVNNQGKVIKSLPEFTRAVLTGKVVPMAGKTPIMLIGSLSLIYMLLLVLGMLFTMSRLKR